MRNRSPLLILDVSHCLFELDMIQQVEELDVILLYDLDEYLEQVLFVANYSSSISAQELYHRLILMLQRMKKGRS